MEKWLIPSLGYRKYTVSWRHLVHKCEEVLTINGDMSEDTETSLKLFPLAKFVTS